MATAKRKGRKGKAAEAVGDVTVAEQPAWEHEADFQSDGFSSSAWLSAVMQQLLDAQSPPGEPAREPYAFEHLDALSKGLQRCAMEGSTLRLPSEASDRLRDEVTQRERELQAYAAELEGRVADEEATQQARSARVDTSQRAHSPSKAAVAALAPSVDALLAQFALLDGRVARVGRTAAHVGDRLTVVDATRARAEQAADLISSLALFDTAGEPQLGALFLEDARLGEAAELSARLITLAETGAGAGLAGCARAAERLQSYANGLENRLVKRFDAAEAARDVAEMARAASVLVRFNGGSALMARFVSTRRVFLQLGPADDALLGLGEEAALHDSGSTRPPSGEAEAGEQAAASLRRLGAHFKELLRAAKEEVALAVRVFGEAGRGCAAQLVQRLLEQRVRAALERALCSIGETDDLYRRLAHLLLLAGAAERAAELASRLAQLPGCGGDGSFDATTAVGELFTQWREGYLEEELSVQEALAVGVSMESAERRLARAPDALARAALLLLAPRAVAAGAARLCSALCEGVAAGVVAGQEAAATQAGLSCRAHAASTPATQVVSEGAGALIAAAGLAANAAGTLHDCLAHQAAPLLAADAAAVAQAAAAARVAGNRMDTTICGTLLQAAATGALALERVLQAEQAKADFAPRALGLGGGAGDASGTGLGADRPTVACMRVAQLARLICSAAAPLDARNRTALFFSLASRLVAALETHIGRFSYTPAGGLRLRRDLEEYSTLLEGDLLLSPAAEQPRRLAELRALANLLVAPPTALTALVNGEGMGVAVQREEAVRWLPRRADYRRGERPFRQLTA